MRKCSECESDLDIDICICAEPICLSCQMASEHNCASPEYEQFREGLLSIWVGQPKPVMQGETDHFDIRRSGSPTHARVYIYTSLRECWLDMLARTGRVLENVRR
jgi:hypothetical protein